jgi:2'-5' RNA ligase
MATIRAFVGCTLDDEAMARVVVAARRARSLADEAGWRATWVAPENLHVTVKFLGDVDDTVAASIGDAVASVAVKHDTVRLALDGVSAFPHGRPPRVLYLATRTIEGDLSAIARDVDDAVAAFEVPRDERPFRGHLTLARLKFVPRRDGLEPVAAKLAPMLTGEARIDALTLYRSELLPNGPRYHVLGRYPLRPRNVPDDRGSAPAS